MKFVKQVPPSLNHARNTKRQTEIDAEVAQLKSRPGHWAIVREEVSPGSSKVYKDRGCLVTMRTHPGYQNLPPGQRRYDVYASWPLSSKV